MNNTLFLQEKFEDTIVVIRRKIKGKQWSAKYYSES